MQLFKVSSILLYLLRSSWAYKTFGQTDRQTDRQGDSYQPLKTVFDNNKQGQNKAANSLRKYLRLYTQSGEKKNILKSST